MKRCQCVHGVIKCGVPVWRQRRLSRGEATMCMNWRPCPEIFPRIGTISGGTWVRQAGCFQKRTSDRRRRTNIQCLEGRSHRLATCSERFTTQALLTSEASGLVMLSVPVKVLPVRTRARKQFFVPTRVFRNARARVPRDKN